MSKEMINEETTNEETTNEETTNETTRNSLINIGNIDINFININMGSVASAIDLIYPLLLDGAKKLWSEFDFSGVKKEELIEVKNLENKKEVEVEEIKRVKDVGELENVKEVEVEVEIEVEEIKRVKDVGELENVKEVEGTIAEKLEDIKDVEDVKNVKELEGTIAEKLEDTLQLESLNEVPKILVNIIVKILAIEMVSVAVWITRTLDGKTSTPMPMPMSMAEKVVKNIVNKAVKQTIMILAQMSFDKAKQDLAKCLVEDSEQKNQHKEKIMGDEKMKSCIRAAENSKEILQKLATRAWYKWQNTQDMWICKEKETEAWHAQKEATDRTRCAWKNAEDEVWYAEKHLMRVKELQKKSKKP